MNDKIDAYINSIDNEGENFLEKIIKPIARGSLKLVLSDNKIAQAYLTFKTAFMENKISTFLQYLSEKNNTDTINFIDDLNDTEKKFFIESVNKVIDLDDDVQIYVLAYLANKYKTNNELNYYEKQLFYNISTFSEDDFKIYFCIFSEHIKNINNFITLTSYVQKEIITISLNKFAQLGLIRIGRKIGQNQDTITYEVGEYSEVFFECLQGYFANQSCDVIIKKNEPAKIKGGFGR